MFALELKLRFKFPAGEMRDMSTPAPGTMVVKRPGNHFSLGRGVEA
jgi:hypothetical protein